MFADVFCFLLSNKRVEQCCSIARYITICMYAQSTPLRCGHVCLVGIDVVHDDDDNDPIIEQLTLIVAD
jgi:hypothetical protein